MRIGGSLFMIAVGAILTYAVTARIQWIDIQTVGVILMLVGIIALALSLYWMFGRRRTDVVQYSSPPAQYTQPEYGQGPYGEPQYGQPQYGQPQYGQRTTTYEQGYHRG